MISRQELINKYPNIELNSYHQIQSLYMSYSTLNSIKQLSILVNRYTNINSFNPSDSREIINYLTRQYYPNEAIIKASFINNVLLKSKNSITVFEMKTNTRRVDLLKLNGESIAYEIKTDLDNFDRLSHQVNEYRKVFEKTYVICSENRREEVEKCIPCDVGIYTYKMNRFGNYSFYLLKRAKKSKIIDSNRQINILTKKERENYNILDSKDVEDINRLFKQALKNRYYNNWNFLVENRDKIYEIDYQWFFKNCVDPKLIYSY